MKKSQFVTLLLLVAASAAFAAPPDLWPLTVQALPSPVLSQQCAKIDASAGTLPPELAPAAHFQKAFLQAVSGAAESAWLPDFQRLVTTGSGALADVSRAWIARCEMRQIDGVLLKFYRKHVAFPVQFSEVEPDLSEALRRDPWGQPWIYNPHAPAALGERFAKFTTQRYRIAPTRFPELGTLATAIGNRNPPMPSWKITSRNLGGKKALEFRSGAKVSTIEPGGKVDAFTLLFIGDNWALMAGVDQLFTVTF